MRSHSLGALPALAPEGVGSWLASEWVVLLALLMIGAAAALIVVFLGKRPHGTFGDDVRFVAYRPRSIAPGEWRALLVYAHKSLSESELSAGLPDPAERVRKSAPLALAAMGESASSFESLAADATRTIPKGDEITLVPDIAGVEFNPPSVRFRWIEEVHAESLRFCAHGARVGDTLAGTLSVYLGPLVVAELQLALRVRDESKPAAPLAGPVAEDPADLEPVVAKPYAKIFPSYSHTDTDVVEACEEVARVLGDRYLRDAVALRSGERWNARLAELIEEADVFQLFWSSSSMRSPYCRQEWEHALSLGREQFVRPTYWEDPLPRDETAALPPPALAALHFHRFDLDALDLEPRNLEDTDHEREQDPSWADLDDTAVSLPPRSRRDALFPAADEPLPRLPASPAARGAQAPAPSSARPPSSRSPSSRSPSSRSPSPRASPRLSPWVMGLAVLFFVGLAVRLQLDRGAGELAPGTSELQRNASFERPGFSAFLHADGTIYVLPDELGHEHDQVLDTTVVEDFEARMVTDDGLVIIAPDDVALVEYTESREGFRVFVDGPGILRLYRSDDPRLATHERGSSAALDFGYDAETGWRIEAPDEGTWIEYETLRNGVRVMAYTAPIFELGPPQPLDSDDLIPEEWQDPEYVIG